MEPSEGRRSSHTVLVMLRLDRELPTGRAFGRDGAEHPFTGWLGLMGAIQALVADDRAADTGLDLGPDSGRIDPGEERSA